ncbi:MAG: DUF4760 domain-containing protein [Proteobacteria bacterium]|nr:DUF4760 domain-containing protein [Pseudomonadota bacterium]
MTAAQAYFLLAITAGIGLASICIAIWNIRENKKIARVRHTLEFLEAYNRNPRIDEAHEFIREIKDKGNSDQIKEFENKENRVPFLFLLNQFEILAIGLSQGIYDKELIEKSFGYDVYEIYQNSEKLINYIRQEKGDDGAFRELEKLATTTKFEYISGKNQTKHSNKNSN